MLSEKDENENERKLRHGVKTISNARNNTARATTHTRKTTPYTTRTSKHRPLQTTT